MRRLLHDFRNLCYADIFTKTNKSPLYRVLLLNKKYRNYSNVNVNNNVNLKSKSRLVLGIETSCDDTGAAVVDHHGNVIGDALHNQTKTHIQ